MKSFTGIVVTPSGAQAKTVHFDTHIRDMTAPAGPLERGVLVPGSVDVHVHINEPGRTEWEGFETATKAAVAGGTTTVVDMPLNCIPATTNVDALELKRTCAKRNAYCNVGFWGGAVPGNVSDLRPLFDAKVLGFKCFMVPSGVDEFDFVPTEDLRAAAIELAKFDAVLLAHAEDPAVIMDAAKNWDGADPRSYPVYLSTRPEAAETKAIDTLIKISKETNCRVHVVHVAAEAALEKIARAKQDGVRITAETCAHYLFFSADDVADGQTQFKCAPPIREPHVRDALWSALGNGTLDFVTTDHSPAPPSTKELQSGRFDKAWGGIASMQLFTRVVLHGVIERGYHVEDFVRWCSASPSAFAGIKGRGKIEVGAVADLVQLDVDVESEIRVEDLFHRHKISPYDAVRLRGEIMNTWLSGDLAWDGSQHLGKYGTVL